jgi:hypothetical protein
MRRHGCRVILIVAALLAATTAAAQAGSYSTWAKAQKAAGFKLLVPHKTFGLTSNPISVDPCFVTGALKKRQVSTVYGKDHHPQLGVYETNNPFPCFNNGESTTLATYTVHHHKATLIGFCGLPHLPSCSSKKVLYHLSWSEPHRAYFASAAGGATIKQLVDFARSWK